MPTTRKRRGGGAGKRQLPSSVTPPVSIQEDQMDDAISTPTPPTATRSALEWDPSRISEDKANELIEQVEELIDAVSVAKRKVDYAIDDGQDEDDAIAEA